VLGQCARLIEGLLPNLHVVLASRVEPPPRLFRVRLSDDLVELRASDLAFTCDEAAQMLPSSQVEAAIARTQGWALGLELLADDSGVDDYLISEVLSPQPDEVHAFLVSTSVLDRMSGPLCDFVMSGRGSQATLEYLEDSGAFVSSLDARREWFECHPLFRSALRRLLQGADGTTREQDLLRRAAEWCLECGEVEEGVRYLIAAGAGDEVVEAAFTHGSTMFERHRVGEVAGWIEQAPRVSLNGHASVLLLEAAAMVFGNTPSEACGILDTVEGLTAASASERLIADLLRSYVELAECRPSEAVGASARVLAGIDTIDDAELPNLFGLTSTRMDVVAAARVARAVALMYDGDLPSARVDLEAVDDRAHGVWRASALGALSLVEAWSGRLNRGEELANLALSLADSLGHDTQSRTTAWLARALIARERGQFDRAATLLEDVDLAGGTRRRAVSVWVATERALIALASDIAPAGLAALAGQLVSAHPSLPSGVLARRWAAEAQLLIASGDLAGAAEIVELGLGSGSSELAAARVRLAVERGDTARARALVDGWPHEPEPRARRERQLWTAILDHLDGDEAAACAAMRAVVVEAEAEGDVGLFHSAGKYALGPLRALYRSAPTIFLRALVDQPFIVGRVKPAKGLAEQLTDREYMVLVHLPSRQSNAEIAQRLGVSLNTVKTHLKHIYRKLDVVGRSDAVEAAERLHLL
jgi:LuxR family maltose regulon positive regulatory protein